MTAVLAREAFGAEFVGADGFLNTPTYGLPPRFLIDALRDCIGQWQAGTMEVPVVRRTTCATVGPAMPR